MKIYRGGLWIWVTQTGADCLTQRKQQRRCSLFPVFISWIFECLCCLTKTVFGALSYYVELGKRCVLLWVSLIPYAPIASLVPVRGCGHPWIILSVSSLYLHFLWKWPLLLSVPSANSTGIIEELVRDAGSVCTSKVCLTYEHDIPGGSDGKESACNVGDLGLIPGSGRSPWTRKWKPNPCLENFMDRGAWRVTVHGVTKSRTQLSD